MFNIRSSFKTKLILSLSATILVIFCVSGYISYRTYLHLFENEISRQFYKSNEQALARLEIHVQNMYRTSDHIVFHPYIEEIVQRSSKKVDLTHFEKLLDLEELEQLLNDVKFNSPQLFALYLYDLNGKEIYYNSNQAINRMSEVDYLQIEESLEGTNGRVIWKRMSFPSSIEKSGYRSMIVASRLMKNPYLESYGIMVMVFDETIFSKFLNELIEGETGKVYLFDQQDQLLYTDEPSGTRMDTSALLAVNQSQINNMDQIPYMFAKSKSDDILFTLVSRVSLEDIQKNSRIIFKIALYSGVVGMVLTSILVTMTSQQLLRPLRKVLEGMRRLREGKFDTQIDIQTKDELAFIGQNFNSMAANIQNLIKEVYERQLNERNAELKALQAQLNPHFLYNTLDTIYWSVYLKDDMETGKLVVALSQMLRYALESVHEMTTLEDEIGQVRNYLYIQGARFKENLQTTISIEDEVRDCLLIRFIMQPLVENIFVHAFRNKPSEQEIEIRAYRDADRLIITIVDNGCGMDEDTVNRIMGSGRDATSDPGAKESIGIQSVIRRIALIYGEGFGLKIMSRPESGTEMNLVLPYLLREDT